MTSNFKVSGNFYTVLVVAMFFGSVVYLSNAQPAIAPVFTAAMLPFVIGIVGTIQRTEAGVQEAKKATEQIAVVDAKVETVAAVSTEAKVAAVASVAASKENAQTLAVTAVQTAQALEQQAQSIGVVSEKQDTTNHMVDGQLSAILKEQKELRNQVAALMQERAVNAVKLDYAVDSEARIIAAVAAVAPAPSTGSTPPHGTPIDGGSTIAPGGPTTIIVDPDHPIALEAEQKLPKGKRPKVGDQ